MASARLNIFQRLVRQWDGLHPYNAVQIMHLDGQADTDALLACWHDALATLGLGRVQLRGNSYQCEVLNGQAVSHTLRVVPPTTSLQDFVSTQLNQRFEEDEDVPFRPFVLQQNGSHYAGVIYHHWIADSVSIRLLLREWFLRRYDPAKARRTPLALPDAGYWSLLGPRRANWRLGQALWASVRWSRLMEHVRRIPGSMFNDFSARFSLFRLPEGLIAPLHAWARQHHVTVNDLFLAAIAEACDRHMPFQRIAGREDLALGTIVDLRPYCPQDLSDTFGLFLGFSNVVCQPRDMTDFAHLAQTIAGQNAQQKNWGVPQSSTVRMAAGLTLGRLLSQRRLVTLYRKRTPFAGGISNVNLTRSWAADYHPSPLLDYIRVSPTGPMLPLVFTPTTLKQHLHVGLTYRPSVVSDERVQAIVQTFQNRLQQLAAPCPSGQIR